MEKPFHKLIFVLSFLSLVACSSFSVAKRPPSNAPVWPAEEASFKVHGQQISSPYRWLRDREGSSVRLKSLLSSEQNYFDDGFLSSHRDLVSQIKSEILKRTPKRMVLWFQEIGRQSYWLEQRASSSEVVLMRRDSNSQSEVEIFNFTKRLGEKAILDGGVINQNVTKFAIGIDVAGNEKTELHILDLVSGVLRNTGLSTDDSIEWLNDNETVVFAAVDKETLRPDGVKTLHLPSGLIKEVFKESDVEFQIRLSSTDESKNIVVTSYSSDSTEVYLLAKNGTGQLKKLFSRIPGRRIRCFDAGTYQIILSNHKGSNQDLYFAELGESELSRHKLLYRRPNGLHIRGYTATDAGVIFDAGQGVESRLFFIPRSDAKWGVPKEIVLKEKQWSMRFEKRARLNLPSLDVWYSSYSTTVAPFRLSLGTSVESFAKEPIVPNPLWSNSAVSESDFIVSSLSVKSRDGVEIPVTVLTPIRDNKSQKKFPALVTGYAAYGSSLDPTFYHGLMSLLSRGFRLVFVHARGGGDLGLKWHDAGRKQNKMNSFHDVIDAVEWLKSNDWIDSETVFAEGNSAGGLLMGAVVNISPNLFRSVHLKVPFLDVLSTMLDESLPLTSIEFQEWGNPKKRSDFDVIRRYSPVDNIKRTAYPSILVTAGLNDKRVPYWEPIKYVATIRKLRSDDRPTFLRMDLEGGHEGENDLEKDAELRAQEMAFFVSEYERFQTGKRGIN